MARLRYLECLPHLSTHGPGSHSVDSGGGHVHSTGYGKEAFAAL